MVAISQKIAQYYMLKVGAAYSLEFESLKDLLQHVARERSLDPRL